MLTLAKDNPHRREIIALFQAALATFVVTALVGLLNGLDVVEFDRTSLLTHVHAGAIGWLALGFLGACLWAFSGGPTLRGWHESLPRWLAICAIGAATLNVFAFYVGNATFRPIAGGLILLAIAGLLYWAVARSLHMPLSTAHLALLAALATLTLGALIGTVLGIYLAGGLQFLPRGLYMSHPTTMVVGFLILAGMGISEWLLAPERSKIASDRLGIIQIALPFLGGIALTVGALLDIFALIVLNVPFEVLGVSVYLWIPAQFHGADRFPRRDCGRLPHFAKAEC